MKKPEKNRLMTALRRQRREGAPGALVTEDLTLMGLLATPKCCNHRHGAGQCTV